MAIATEIKSKLPLIIGAIVVVAILYFVMQSGGGASGGTSYSAVQPDTQSQAQLGAAAVAANASLTSNYESMIAGEFAALNQTAQTLANDRATVDVANIQGQTTRYQYSAQLAAAEAAAAAQRAIAGDQLSAVQAQAHASQQNTFWSGLFGTVGSIAGAFGL